MLDTIIELIARIDVVLYFLSGLGFLLGLRGLSVARRLRREAVFGLEKEAARNARRRGLSTVLSMLLLAGAIYLLTNVVQPTMENMPVAGSDLTGTPDVWKQLKRAGVTAVKYGATNVQRTFDAATGRLRADTSDYEPRVRQMLEDVHSLGDPYAAVTVDIHPSVDIARRHPDCHPEGRDGVGETHKSIPIENRA